MPQFLLAAYLSAFVVFGPVLCCCSVPSFFRCQADDATLSHSGCHAGCHHRESHADDNQRFSQNKRGASAGNEPSSSDRQSHRCPCKKDIPCMAAFPAGEKSCDQIDSGQGLWLDAHSQLAAITLRRELAIEAVKSRPATSSGRAILRACHKLQC